MHRRNRVRQHLKDDQENSSIRHKFYSTDAVRFSEFHIEKINHKPKRDFSLGFYSKVLFTYRWGTPDRRSNPLRWGNQPVCIIFHMVALPISKRDHIKMRDYMNRRVTPSKRVTSPTWGPPPP